MKEKNFDQKLRVDAAAKYLGVAVQTLHNWRFRGTGPSYYKIGNRIFYRTSDLDKFEEKQRVEIK
jgi:hypothetical protein